MSISLIYKSKTLSESASCGRLCGPIINRALVTVALWAMRAFGQRNGYNYFFTISAFSIMAMPPRSAILPFNVIVFPQYSAS